MPRRLIVLLAIGTAAAVFGACGSQTTPEGLTLSGVDGVATDVSDPTRIVSMAGDITEIIFELGHGERVVGIDVTTVHPAEATSLPIVGVNRFLNAEAILALDPTLVIADNQAAPVTAIDQIRQAGVPVLVLPAVTTFPALYDKIAALGDVVGDPESAQALSERIHDEVAAALSNVPIAAPDRVAYIYTRGRDVVLMFGAGMASQPVIEAAGAIDAGLASGIEGSIPATAEAIVAAAPDVIVVPEEGYSILGGLDEFLAIPGIAQTPAGANRAILAYPEGDFLTFGPRVADSIRRLAADLDALR